MPRQRWGSPLTDAADVVMTAVDKRRDRNLEREKDREWWNATGLSGDPKYRDITAGITSGRLDRQSASNAINQRQEQDKLGKANDDQRVRDLTEKTLQLANERAGTSDPTATRGNLDLPQFRAMPGGAQAPKVPGGVERPDQGVVKQIEDVQSAYPGMSKTERLDPVRSRMRPGDEGLAGVASRSIGAAEDRQRIKKLTEDTQRLSAAKPFVNVPGQPEKTAALQGLFESGQLAPGQAPGLLPDKPPEPQRPTWDRQDRIDEARRRGLTPGTPEYFDFVHKEDGAEKPSVSNAAVAGVYRTILMGLVNDREKSRSMDFGALKDMTDEEIKMRADSLAQMVVGAMQEGVIGQKEIPDEQGAAVQADIQELQSLIKMAKQKLGIR